MDITKRFEEVKSALVQISPDYADLGQQAEPAPLRFEAGGGGSGDGNDGGGGKGGAIS